MKKFSSESRIPEFPEGVRVVGTVHSPGALRCALKLKPGSVDVLELRLDAFVSDLETLEKAARRLKFPLLITARHPAEGGVGGLSAGARGALYRRFLPYAVWMDVELRSMKPLAHVVSEARTAGVQVVVSSHFFRRMPSLTQLKALAGKARRAGADVFKLAARAERPADVATLLGLFPGSAGQQLAVMGMGAFGQVSRLVLARAGSVLNYGYLDQPNASGQWEATELRKQILKLTAGA